MITLIDDAVAELATAVDELRQIAQGATTEQPGRRPGLRAQHTDPSVSTRVQAGDGSGHSGRRTQRRSAGRCRDNRVLRGERGCHQHPLAIVMLSQHVETRHSVDLVVRGRFGYLLKDRVLDVDDFLDTLRRVAAGGSALDPEVVARMVGGGAEIRLAP